MNNKLLLIELNEINFEYLRNYIRKYDLIYLKAICGLNQYKTESESKYNQLEPWIQWTSAHTGKNYDGHKIFRLGDIKKYSGNQIFETIEKMGFSVGAVSPMNADLRMSKPDFFIPDPWTQSDTDKSFWSKNIHDVIKQTVNDNSQGRITLKSIIFLILAMLKFSKPKNYLEYLLLAFGALKGKKWNKALFLDLFLCDVFINLTLKNKTNFSTLFLNSFAHIQHHYFFNSEFYKGNSKNPKNYIIPNCDPMKDAAFFFDKRIKNILDSFVEYDFLFATGLSQIPYSGEKYYYRLKNHSRFLETLGLTFKRVNKRMTRDFEIIFNSNSDRDDALNAIKKIEINNIILFKEIEIRNKSLFITLTYEKKILNSDYFKIGNKKIFILDCVVNVAFKNGEHCGTGYAFLSNGLVDDDSKKKIKIWDIRNIIYKYFKKNHL